MITGAEIEALFRINFNVLRFSFKDITEELARFQPQPAGNCINWILGHILVSSDNVLTLIGQDKILTPEQSEPYRRGSKPIETDNFMKLSQLQSILIRIPKRMKDGLERLITVDLAVIGDRDESLSYQLTFLHFHEAYHCGQIGLLRRLVGLEGVIK